MINFAQFPIHRVLCGETSSVGLANGQWKLTYKLDVTLDLSKWADKIYSVHDVARGIYHDDATLYITDKEIGLEHKHEPCIRWDGKSKANLPLTSNFDDDLRKLAKMVLSDFDAWVEYELKETKAYCEEYDADYVEESAQFNDSQRWAHAQLSWINES